MKYKFKAEVIDDNSGTVIKRFYGDNADLLRRKASEWTLINGLMLNDVYVFVVSME